MQRKTKVKLLVMLLLLTLPLIDMAEERKVTYFSPGSFYLYAMGGWIGNVPTGYYNEGEGAGAPFVGAGFTMVRFGRRMLMNMEFDTSRFTLNDGWDSTQIWLHTLLFNLEYRFGRQTPWSAYAGFGGGLFHYDFDDNEYTFAFNLGLKMHMSKHLMLRAELRHYWKTWGGDGWYDEWGYYEDDSVSESWGTAVAVGAEIHF